MMNNKNRAGYFILLILLFGSDQWTKNNIETLNLLFSNWIHLQSVQNSGVVLGYFNDVSGFINVVGLNTIGAVVILLYFGFFYLNRHQRTLLNLGALFVFSGILGNWHDRFLKHHVIDFIVVDWVPNMPAVAFNLADVFIWIGFIIILTQSNYFGHFLNKYLLLNRQSLRAHLLEMQYFKIFLLLTLNTGFLVFVFSYSFLKLVLSSDQLKIDTQAESQIMNLYWISFLALFVVIILFYSLAAKLVSKNILAQDPGQSEVNPASRTQGV